MWLTLDDPHYHLLLGRGSGNTHTTQVHMAGHLYYGNTSVQMFVMSGNQ